MDQDYKLSTSELSDLDEDLDKDDSINLFSRQACENKVQELQENWPTIFLRRDTNAIKKRIT